MQQVQELAKLKDKPASQSIEINGLSSLRCAAKLRYGKSRHGFLTEMALKYGVQYTYLSHVLHGRHHLSSIVAAIQKDFDLSDAQVLACWPLLRRWPRPDLEERAMRRAG